MGRRNPGGCGGSGLQSDLVTWLRLEVFRLELALELAERKAAHTPEDDVNNQQKGTD